jgi:serine protease
VKEHHWWVTTFALSAILAAGVARTAPVNKSRAIDQGNYRTHAVGAVIGYTPDRRSLQTRFNRFIVKYRASSSAYRSSVELQRRVNAAATAANLTVRSNNGGSYAMRLRHVRKLSTGGHVFVAPRWLGAQEVNALLQKLRSDPEIVFAQPDYFKFRQDVVPNDPRFVDLQWDLTHPAAGIGAPRAWDISSGQGVSVAVLDTGYVDHRDLAANLVPGYDFVSWFGQTVDGQVYPDVAGDGDGRDADAHDPGDWLDGTESFCGRAVAHSSWHGTHVAGTIASVANNGFAVAGIAYGAKVQPVRVLGHCGGLTSDIADGIVWASGGHVDGAPDNLWPAEVLNLSLGGYGRCSEDPVTQEAINDAVARGVSVVVAAGNNSLDAADFSPASCAGVIAVGATGVDGARSYFSNYGVQVAIAAPGGNARSSGDAVSAWIWSLGNNGQTSPIASPEGDVLIGQIGTSMAAPHVAATLALVQSAAVASGHPALSPFLAKAVLRATAKPFALQPSPATPIGTGIVDAAAAVAAATRGITEPDLAVTLANRAPSVVQGMSAGDATFYRLNVPIGVRSMTLRTYGGTGDVSLYVAKDAVPLITQTGNVSSRPGTTEALLLSAPAAGTYYIRVQALSPSKEVSVMAVY